MTTTTLLPCVNSTLHREVQSFRWELPKAACGVILHPYKQVDPEVADLTVRCETCFPPAPAEPDDRWGYRAKKQALLDRFDAPGLQEALTEVTDALLQEARYHATWPVCTAEKWRYDRMLWVFDVMLGNVPADSHAPSAEDERYR